MESEASYNHNQNDELVSPGEREGLEVTVRAQSQEVGNVRKRGTVVRQKNLPVSLGPQKNTDSRGSA